VDDSVEPANNLVKPNYERDIKDHPHQSPFSILGEDLVLEILMHHSHARKLGQDIQEGRELDLVES